MPGPGQYNPKDTEEIAPIGGTFSCTVQAYEDFEVNIDSPVRIKKTITLN